MMYTYLPPLRLNEPPGYSFESPVTAFGATEIDGRRVLPKCTFGGVGAASASGSGDGVNRPLRPLRAATSATSASLPSSSSPRARGRR